MSNHFKNIRIALDSKLDAMGSDTIAWPGFKFDPSTTSIYLRPTILPAVSDTAQLNRMQNDAGLYQVDVIATRDTDLATLLDKADEIRTHFQGVDSLTESGTTILLRSVSQLQFSDDEAFLVLPVQVAWESYTT